MKTFTLSFIVMLGLSLSFLQTRATHFVGGEFSYRCLGGTSYEVAFVFYRDCSGIPAPTTVPVTYACSSNPLFNFTANLQLVPGSGQEVTQTCPSMTSYCSSGTNYGVQVYLYKGTVNLPTCNEWLFSYSSSARNPITTIPNSMSANWYIPVQLNTMDAPCNNSAIDRAYPEFIVCNNVYTELDLGSVDPDGDSLVYSLCAPKTTGMYSTVSYQWPYTATNFLSSSTPIVLDSLTGMLSFTPSLNLVTAFGVKVEEWRTVNGIPKCIATRYRDIQLKVITCTSNQKPLLLGFDTSLSSVPNLNDTIYHMSMCVGGTAHFRIHPYDTDTNAQGNPENLTMHWDSLVPGASFVISNNGANNAYGEFSWTPTAADAGRQHCFTVGVKDEACPYTNVRLQRYCIDVVNVYLEIGSDTTVCQGASFMRFAQGNTPAAHCYWKLDSTDITINPLVRYTVVNTDTLSPGYHHLQAQLDTMLSGVNCYASDAAVIEVLPRPALSLGPDSILPSTSSIVLNGPYGMSQYLWSTGSMSAFITVDSTGGAYQQVSLQVIDGNGCANSDTVVLQFLNVGIDELNNQEVSVHPVPFTDLVKIQQTDGFLRSAEVFANDGSLLMHVELDALDTELNLSHLPAGAYILRLSGDSGFVHRKLLKR